MQASCLSHVLGKWVTCVKQVPQMSGIPQADAAKVEDASSTLLLSCWHIHHANPELD